jgi:hypothetical protein
MTHDACDGPGRETREANRRNFIDRFRKEQSRMRRWIEFRDLADWCARSTTTTGAAEQAKAQIFALDQLANAILNGQFEDKSRSQVLLLDARARGVVGSAPCRLHTAAFARQCEYAAEMTPLEPLPLETLAKCWLPREVARQWIEMHGYRWPSHFDPSPGPNEEQNRRPHGSKLAEAAWPVAEQILEDDTRRPPPGYGRLIKLARLVNAELGQRDQDESVRKAIGPSLREWERRNPRR